MKRLISLMLALAMVFALSACGSNDSKGSTPESPAAETPSTETPAADPSASETPAAETPAAADAEYTLIVNLNKPEVASAPEIDWMNAITEASGGRIQFEPYYSSSLLSASEVPQGLKDGIIDIAIASSAEWPSIIPTSAYVLSMPFTGITGDIYYEILPQLMEEFPEIEQEFTDASMKLIGYTFGSALNLFTVSADAEVRVPADLKGMQIIATESTMQSLISDAGGAPVSCGPSDFYSYLERSVADGIFNHWGTFANSAVYEVVDQVIMFGEEDNSSCTQNFTVTVMSQQCWDSLPADLQQIVLDCAPVQRETQNQQNLNLIERSMAAIEDNGITLVRLSDDEVAAWSEAFAPIRDELLSGLDADGANTQVIFNRVLELAGK